MLLSLWGGNISVRRADWLEAINRPRTSPRVTTIRSSGYCSCEPAYIEFPVDYPTLRGTIGISAHFGGSCNAQRQLQTHRYGCSAANPDLLDQVEPQSSRGLALVLLAARSPTAGSSSGGCLSE